MIDALNFVQDNYFYYVATLIGAIAAFFSTYAFGNEGLERDIREICLYDIFLQLIGGIFYFFQGKTSIYIGLLYSIVFLKFGRLVWPCGIDNSFLSWPSFGVLGFFEKNRLHVAEMNWQQQSLVYAYIFICLVFGYLIAFFGWKLKLSHFSIIPLIAIPFFYRRIISHLTLQHQAQLISETMIAVEKASAQAAMNIAFEQARLHKELALKNVELERLNQENQLNLQQLQSLNAALRDASHDLKQPMFVVKARADHLIQSEPGLPHAQAARELSDGILLMQEYIDDVIYNAKVATQLAPPSLRAISMTQIVRDIRRDFLPLADERNLYLGIYPVVLKELLVRADMVLLHRILRNLVVNAILHTGNGGILISARKRKDACLVQVWDSGPGIAIAKNQNGMTNFEEFVVWARECGGRYGSDGHGLGINNVRQLCISLGIHMHLHSRLGRGSVFSFILPLADADLIAVSQRELAQEQMGEAQNMVY